MSMTLGNMTDAIYDRLVASLPADTRSGIFHGMAPADSYPDIGERPLVVFNLSIVDESHGFTSDRCTVTVEFRVIDRRANGSTNSVTVMSRIYGNANPGTQAAPTYGFHRHILTGFRFVVGSDEVLPVPTACMRQSETTEHDADTLVYVATYMFRVHR